MRSLDVIAVVEAGLMSALVAAEMVPVCHVWLGVRTGGAVGAGGRPGRQASHVETGLLLAVARVLLVTVTVVLVIMLRLVLVMILWLMVVSVVIVVTHMIVIIS